MTSHQAPPRAAKRRGLRLSAGYRSHDAGEVDEEAKQHHRLVLAGLAYEPSETELAALHAYWARRLPIVAQRDAPRRAYTDQRSKWTAPAALGDSVVNLPLRSRSEVVDALADVLLMMLDSRAMES
jgi:hypothetical protein